jgi:hypothetical protein
MRFINKAPFFFLFLFVFSSSCKKDKIDMDCGCDGSTILNIENLEARHTGNGYFAINKVDTNGGLTYGWACDVDSTWETNTDQTSWNYTISGNLKKRCPVNFDIQNLSMLAGGPIEIKSLRKNN